METAKKTATICLVITGFAALLFFIYLSRNVILLLIVAAILAISIHPLVRKLMALRVKKIWAIVIAFVILIVVLTGVIAIIITPLIHQAITFEQNLPMITQDILNNSTFVSLNQRFHILESIQQYTANGTSILYGGSTSLLFILSNAVSVLSTTAIILVMTFLLLVEGENIWKQSIEILQVAHKKVAERISQKIVKAVSGFILGNLFISLIAGIVTYATLLICGVSYALPLAALVALFDLIPLVGAAIATIIVALVALTKSFIIAVVVVVVLLIYQFIEGHVIQPVVYSRSVDLSAFLVVIASIIGADIYGIVGILLAIPLVAIIQILVIEIMEYFAIINKSPEKIF